MTNNLISLPSGFEYVNKNSIETGYSMEALHEVAEDEFYSDLDWFYQAHDNGNGTTCLIRRPKNLFEVFHAVNYFKSNKKNFDYVIKFQGRKAYKDHFSSINRMNGELSIRMGEDFGWYLLSREQLLSATKQDDGSWSIPSNSVHPYNLILYVLS
ncbi:hypothetical protein D051_0014 [Vibrio parahaemolyticus VPCR-2010]|uniref:hypothetical protein n=1 Tax=Vibrio parahaemolyticus TaxID=670 RepID=UPI00038E4DB8|nr:hypothetical protein D051_0014 [Vibrio parahaemolyticus VPCR-2010]